jgi:hypothetical protein
MKSNYLKNTDIRRSMICSMLPPVVASRLCELPETTLKFMMDCAPKPTLCGSKNLECIYNHNDDTQ